MQVAILICALELNSGCCSVQVVQDNPVLREFLSKAVKAALSKYDSEQTAWYIEKNEDKRWGVVKWTEEAKSWVWLDQPQENLKVNFTKCEIKGNVLSFEVNATAKAKGKAWGKIPRVFQGDVRFSSNVEIVLKGTATIQGLKCIDVDITELQGKLSDLRFNNDLLKAVQGLIKDCANEYIVQRNKAHRDELKRSIEQYHPNSR